MLDNELKKLEKRKSVSKFKGALKGVKGEKALYLALAPGGDKAPFHMEGPENFLLGARKDDFSRAADWESLPLSLRRDIEFSLMSDNLVLEELQKR